MGVHVLRGEFPSSSGCRTTPACRSPTSPRPSSSSSACHAACSIWCRRSPRSGSPWPSTAPARCCSVTASGLLGILFMTWVSAYAAANYTLARSYYVEHLLVGQVVLLGAALWLARPLSEPARCRVAIAMGLAGGLGLYFNFQIVDALVPAALALLLVEPRLPFRRAAWLGVGAFLLGSLPFWAYNLTHDWATFRTGARYQGQFPGIEAARDPVPRPPPGAARRPGRHRPAPPPAGPAGLDDPADRRRRRSRSCWSASSWDSGGCAGIPARAGEALLLAGIAVTLGVVWYGGYVRVPRYLLPLVPLLALVLARAAQLTWRWTRVGTIAWVAVYLVAVGLDLVPDITALRPEARLRGTRRERQADARLLDLLRANDLRHAYAFTYWLAPRLTFDGGGDIIVAQPFNDRYPPHTRAVDRSPRPAYVLQAGADVFRDWLAALRVGARERGVGDYRVFDQFTPPPEAVPLPRAGWTRPRERGARGRRQRDRRPSGHRLVEQRRARTGRPGSRWTSAPSASSPGSRSSTTAPSACRTTCSCWRTATAGRPRRVAAVAPEGVAVRWENGAPRVGAQPHPDRALRAGDDAPPPARRGGPRRALERGGAVPAGPASPGHAARTRRPPCRGGPPARGRRTVGARAPALSRGDASAPRTIRRATTPSPGCPPRSGRALRSAFEHAARLAELGTRDRGARRLRRSDARARTGARPRGALAAPGPPRGGGRRPPGGGPPHRGGGRGARARRGPSARSWVGWRSSWATTSRRSRSAPGSPSSSRCTGACTESSRRT